MHSFRSLRSLVLHVAAVHGLLWENVSLCNVVNDIRSSNTTAVAKPVMEPVDGSSVVAELEQLAAAAASSGEDAIVLRSRSGEQPCKYARVCKKLKAVSNELVELKSIATTC